ncbi:type IV toxin-antitoxin system AbiEi family antitoxin domain-containing protein [Aquihabitans sp. G128]|uniref:type IV toxin-antitoxin system AbiEi family antitoxin domain-containing protein n=1 Tax=Aquihabitans sp. G128 TaxID=2849779 RepID=UPI00352E0F93
MADAPGLDAGCSHLPRSCRAPSGCRPSEVDVSEAALVRVAQTQHGLISRRQALEAGVSTEAIKRRLRTGRWLLCGRGVYCVGGAPTTWHQQVLAACLSAGPDVVASHRSAARLWGLVSADGRMELTVAGERRVRVPRTRVHQSILLPALDRTTCDGVPTTTVARTLADVASHQDAQTVGLWIDGAIRSGRLDLLDLRSCLARLSGPGRRDLRPLRSALERRLPGWDPGDSELEARALRALDDAGLPAPVQQHPVRRPDGEPALIDLAYPPQLVAIETEGWEHHGTRGLRARPHPAQRAHPARLGRLPVHVGHVRRPVGSDGPHGPRASRPPWPSSLTCADRPPNDRNPVSTFPVARGRMATLSDRNAGGPRVPVGWGRMATLSDRNRPPGVRG